MKGRIAEIFESVQGEGIYVGERQLFIRFHGCNLKCRFCDTSFQSYQEFLPEQLFSLMNNYTGSYHSVSFTGGEPLMQKNFLKEVLKLSSRRGNKNYLETNGTLFSELEEVIADVDIIAMDIKLPSSCLHDGLWRAHRRFLQVASKKDVFIKSVICDSTNEEDIDKLISLIKEINPGVIVVLQPDSSGNPEELKAKVEYFKQKLEQEQIATCTIPQMHKIIGVS